MSGSRITKVSALVLSTMVCAALSFIFPTVAGAAGPTKGSNVPGSAAAITPFTVGQTFDSGQGVNIVIPANSVLAADQKVFVLECAAPGGVDPTTIDECDGNTNYASGTIFTNADGSVNLTAASKKPYPIYALPDHHTLGEFSANGATCGLGSVNECVLYIGQGGGSDVGLSSPYFFSQPFEVHPDSTDSGTIDAGDGTFPADAAPAITSATSKTFNEGAASTFNVTATGWPPPTYSETGTLPAGVTLTTTTDSSGTTSTGVLAGTPTETGTFPITITATNGISPDATQSFSLDVVSAGSTPGVPTNLAATLGVGTVGLSWSAPGSDGGSPITSYTVNGTDTTTSEAITPVTVSGSPPATNADLTGLTAGDAYSFTVSAANTVGTGAASTALAELLPAPYFPVAPARICDTRASNTTECAGQTLAAGGTLKVQVTGNGNVPAGATAVVANVTVTGATAPSFLTAYPDGTTRPLASNLNFTAGETVPNLVTVPLSGSGALDLYNASGKVNVIVDVDGYYGPGSGEGFTSLTPSRICDTRSNGNSTECVGKTLSAGGTLTVQVTGQGGVPSGASAVVANVTVTGATAASFLTAFPDGTARPLASNLNFTAGESVPNRVIIPLSSSGALDLYNASGSVNAIVDVDGYYSSATSGYFEPLAPARICDTRASNTTPCAGKTLAGGGTLTVQVSGNGGVPSGAAAVVANVTATGASAQSFLTVYPADAASRPLASDLNFVAGESVPNLCVAKLSSTGALDIYNATGTVNALVDIGGYFTS